MRFAQVPHTMAMRSAWQEVRSLDGAGYHFEFSSLAILALARGLALRGHVDHHPACERAGARAGGEVLAACDDDNCFIVVDGDLWMRGDAFDTGREFYALVGFNEAPAAAFDALAEQVGAERAEEIAWSFCRQEW